MYENSDFDLEEFLATQSTLYIIDANVVYTPDANTADKGLVAKAAMFAELGVRVHLCGDVDLPTTQPR